VHSCDTYFYQIGERVPADALASRAKSAGFGRKTGVDLPQELVGNVPDSAWLNRRWGERGWTQGTVLNHSIGQGEYLVTPLQMAAYAAMLARSGTEMTPHLVDSIEEPDGTERPIPPAVTGAWAVQPETIARIREAMHQVVVRGTGATCRIPEMMVAGKTGTAENPHGQAHSWFMGYAPFDAPEVAFAVIVEAGGHGSEVAAPIAKRLLLELVARRAAPKATT
jgi:penicillin-binding protein 2